MTNRTDEVDAVKEFVTSTRYIVTASLYTPKGRLVGRLERTWEGAETIGNLCMTLVTISQDRADLDHCKIDLRWRKG